ncbi:hypothetical protein B484DRAFT_408518 [Ochromonadaceae sp. CCMP2298]|nr:hypothetical protein B484DRAFT_408518 [Ochromonadaceae sp. CCMP2298]
MLSMGEVLYIPGTWFHYIASQDASIQCNARSGNPPGGREALGACGTAVTALMTVRVGQGDIGDLAAGH